MPLTCCLLTNSNRLPNAEQVLQRLNAVDLRENGESFVCWIKNTCCLVQLQLVTNSASADVAPHHRARLVVVLTDTRQSLSQDRSTNLALALLMTRVLTVLRNSTDAVAILWQEHLLHDVEMWDAWCSSELPIPLWIAIVEDGEASDHPLKTIGLDFFRRCEVLLHSSKKADANLLGQFLGLLEYFITSDETLVEGNCFTFHSSETRDTQVEMHIKQITGKMGEKCQAHLEIVE